MVNTTELLVTYDRFLEMLNTTPTTKAFSCDPPCVRRFKTAAALAEHKRYASKHMANNQAGPINGALIREAESPAIANGTGAGPASEIHGTQGVRITAANTNANGQIKPASKDARKRSGGTLAKARKEKTTDEMPRCSLCNKLFATDQALADHVRDSPKHAPAKLADTPLDRFFQSYPTFPYDRSKPPAESFRQLEEYFDWNSVSKARKVAWKAYQQALVDEVQVWFGDVTDLDSWHELCRAVRIRNPPSTIPECKRAVRRTHVNIVDLIEWGRNGRPADSPVKVYKSIRLLREYTFRTGRIFPKEDAIREEDGATNIVLRHLLRDFRIFGVGLRVIK